jgi:ATP-dependent Lhr-like helicase
MRVSFDEALLIAEQPREELVTLDAALAALEGEGVILRGTFSAPLKKVEWCDRRLLARIHRYTMGRLRAEIAPVSAADFMRFLFAWQHVDPSTSLTGPDGLRAVLSQLDGVELPARAWEAYVLPARVQGYASSMLDMLCLTGEVGWARLSSGPAQVVGATPIALFRREHADDWFALRTEPAGEPEVPAVEAGSARDRIAAHLRTHGACFGQDLGAACGLADDALREALRDLVAAGRISSDGFAGLRSIIRGGPVASSTIGRHAAGRSQRPGGHSGRWFVLRRDEARDRAAAIETVAWVLLGRYGVMFRRLLARETNGVPWRDLARVYRRLEARGEIRGGRFVTGVTGEQFALPDAVDRLREIRRSAPDDRLITISAADPLNLSGILTEADRVRASAPNRIVYRNGVPLAAMDGDMLRMLTAVDPAIAPEVAAAAAGRRVPVLSGWVGRAVSERT